MRMYVVYLLGGWLQISMCMELGEMNTTAKGTYVGM